ncbi:hypothetical protein [Marmoricola sp. OAE513]|uniref:hypothetical protein n=1 Tax=Marmoricola sp. OAE513 TaxID=2817894 RepID=UPI001AE10357
MTRLDPWLGCVVGCEPGVAVVRTERGEVRATYSGRMLGRIARDRACAVQTGDWVVLRRWPDKRVTIEDISKPVERCAEVIELHPR